MNQNQNTFRILAILVFVLISLGLFIACEQSTQPAQQNSTSVKFLFESDPNAPASPTWLRSLINEKNDERFSTTMNNKYRFSKPDVVDEARVLVLDMTQWENDSTFLEAWYNSEQTDLWDWALWDSTKDFYENAASLLNSYTGDFYQPSGEFTLNIEDSVARGTITVREGLNYFFIVLRENGTTTFYQEVFSLIAEGEENHIYVQGEPGVFVQISTPQDSSVYQQGTPVFFQGFAEDNINYEFIPDSNYVWFSDKDGQIGAGTFFETFILSVNEHIITLSVTTPSGLSGSDQVRITVTP